MNTNLDPLIYRSLPLAVKDLLDIQGLQAFMEAERHRQPRFEVRWRLSAHHIWIPFAWDTCRQYCGIIAESMHQALDWQCQVWSLEGWCDPDTGAWSTREPVCCDTEPSYWKNGGKRLEPSPDPSPELEKAWQKFRETLPLYELRYWYERPPNVDGTPSQWHTCGRFHELHYAREAKAACERVRGWRCELWQVHPAEYRSLVKC